jgi:hypothetical protein
LKERQTGKERVKKSRSLGVEREYLTVSCALAGKNLFEM